MILGFLQSEKGSKYIAKQIKEILEGIETNQFIGILEEEDKNKLKVGFVKKWEMKMR